jgi:hypothetical protein
MTAQQEQDIRDHTYGIGRYICEREDEKYRNRDKPSYWGITTNYTTIEVDGHAGFTSYGEAKNYARIYVRRLLYDLRNNTPKKGKDDNLKEAKKYLDYVNSLEGDEFERAVLELRDLLIETGALRITKQDY